VKGFIILTGSGVSDAREWVPTAVTALELVRDHMQLRRTSVRIEDERGMPVSFFQLRDMADLENRGKNAIAKQQAMIEALARDGHDTKEAEEVLDALETSQRSHIEHRDWVRKELDNARRA
jgi:hypothetical protein